jgi:hypothetical protein
MSIDTASPAYYIEVRNVRLRTRDEYQQVDALKNNYIILDMRQGRAAAVRASARIHSYVNAR